MASFTVKEGTGFVYTATLKDTAGTVVPLANLTSITLTYYVVADGEAINSRNDQDVKNLNNVTIHATSGLLTWVGQSADTPMSGVNAGATEHHRALFEWVYVGDGTPGKHVVDIYVENLEKVP